jgi:hypothetical protein
MNVVIYFPQRRVRLRGLPPFRFPGFKRRNAFFPQHSGIVDV